MLIREIIEFKCWTNTNVGWKYEETYSDEIYEWSINEFENLKPDWDFIDTFGRKIYDNEDLLIISTYRDLDDNVLKEFEVWESDLIKERMAE